MTRTQKQEIRQDALEFSALAKIIECLRPLSAEQRCRVVASAAIMLGLVPTETCQLVLHVSTRQR